MPSVALTEPEKLDVPGDNVELYTHVNIMEAPPAREGAGDGEVNNVATAGPFNCTVGVIAVAWAMPVFVTDIYTVICCPVLTVAGQAGMAHIFDASDDGSWTKTVLLFTMGDDHAKPLLASTPEALPDNVTEPCPVAENVHVK